MIKILNDSFSLKKKSAKNDPRVAAELIAKGELRYDEKKERDEAWKQIERIFTALGEQIATGFQTTIYAFAEETRNNLDQDLSNQIGNILQEAERALDGGGFKSNIQKVAVSDDKKGKILIPSLNSRMETEVKEGYTVTTNEVTRFFGEVVGFLFGSDPGWGQEVVPDQEEYVIYRENTLIDFKEGLDKVVQSCRKRCKSEVNTWKANTDKEFQRLRNYLGRYHQTLIKGRRDRNMEKEKKEQVLAALDEMKKSPVIIDRTCGTLRNRRRPPLK